MTVISDSEQDIVDGACHPALRCLSQADTLSGKRGTHSLSPSLHQFRKDLLDEMQDFLDLTSNKFFQLRKMSIMVIIRRWRYVPSIPNHEALW
jgi:hypothetical protein